MFRAVITGGLASGKSTAVAHLRSRGVAVIDADAISHDLLAQPGPVTGAIAAEFGPETLAEDGSVDRRRLAAVVFADNAARSRLEAILHPRIRAEMAHRLSAAEARGEPVAVCDIPLFVETDGGAVDRVDAVLTVSAPLDLRLHRAVEGRGMAEADVRGRLAAQATDAQREARADIVLDGSGPPTHLASQLDAWLATLSGTD